MSSNKFRKNQVVQFNKNHAWTGCLGIVEKVKDCGDGEYKYLIGVPSINNILDENGEECVSISPVYEWVFESENALEYVGRAVYSTTPSDEKPDTDEVVDTEVVEAPPVNNSNEIENILGNFAGLSGMGNISPIGIPTEPEIITNPDVPTEPDLPSEPIGEVVEEPNKEE